MEDSPKVSTPQGRIRFGLNQVLQRQESKPKQQQQIGKIGNPKLDAARLAEVKIRHSSGGL